MKLGFLGALIAPFLVAQSHATLILTNGRIWTGVPAQPRAEAVAVLDGRIVAVGASADIARWAGPATQTIDLAGKLVVPGFNDSHVHFQSGGENLSGVQ